MIIPYKDSTESKKKQIAKMFDNIAIKYDFLNHFLSLGIDRYWRKKTISRIKKENPQTILDVATGTGDLAIEAARLNPKKIVGIDISSQMLEIGKAKIAKKNLTKLIDIQHGDSENMNFPENSFDVVMVAFGVRNFENLQAGIDEMFRVVKPEGKVFILEFSMPQKPPFKQIYNFYFNKILPFWGRTFSKDKNAYVYLPESVKKFPPKSDFLNILTNAGFSEIDFHNMTLGVVRLYVAKKEKCQTI